MPAPHAPLRNLLTAVTFTALIAAPGLLHLFNRGTVDSTVENRRLAAAPGWADLSADWTAFPEQVNAWMRDHFGLRRTYLQIGFELDKFLSSSSAFRAVRGDDGWMFNTLNGAMALHQGLLPFAAGEADQWLDGLVQMQQHAEAAGAVFVATIAPNKHTIYPEKLSAYPRRVAGETRLDEVMRRAAARDLPLVDLRAALVAAKTDEKIYYQTDSHWTDLGAYQGFLQLRAALTDQGVNLPNIPRAALHLREKTDFQGDLHGLMGEENGAPETIQRVKIDPALPGTRPRSILIIGDSFSGQLRKYFDATFQEVTFIDNAAGAPDLSKITPGTYDVVLFQIVERYLSRPLSPVN